MDTPGPVGSQRLTSVYLLIYQTTYRRQPHQPQRIYSSSLGHGSDQAAFVLQPLYTGTFWKMSENVFYDFRKNFDNGLLQENDDSYRFNNRLLLLSHSCASLIKTSVLMDDYFVLVGLLQCPNGAKVSQDRLLSLSRVITSLQLKLPTGDFSKSSLDAEKKQENLYFILI
jgi:hypothetical protein